MPPWTGEVQSQQLRRFVVRVDRDGRHGTGFFVPPGWVLSCAHVVADAKHVSLHRPDCAPLPGTVRARSAPHQEGTAFWPFPDLALIQLDDDIEHPVALLDTRPPARGRCDAWGYAAREDGVLPPGSPASFEFEGVEGDEFLKLMAGQATPGLSGAPLVCPKRRAVVGVMTMTRDPGQALGGWAAPISALHRRPRGATGVTTLGTEVLRDSRAAALADRAAWHRVISIEDADKVLRRHWGSYCKPKRAKANPANLLLAEYGVVPYLFREAEIAAALAWCAAPEPLAVSVVSGPGGAGKSRFAVQLCRALDDRVGSAASGTRRGTPSWPPYRCPGLSWSTTPSRRISWRCVMSWTGSGGRPPTSPLPVCCC